MTPEEVGKLANAIYEEKIRHQIEPVEHGVMVRIDVNSGEWEVADGSPGDKLRERRPNARIFNMWVSPPPHIVEVEFNGEIMQVPLDLDYFRRPRTVFGLEKLVRDLESEYGSGQS